VLTNLIGYLKKKLFYQQQVIFQKVIALIMKYANTKHKRYSFRLIIDSI